MKIIVDFDGTISVKDTIDLLLETYGTDQPAIVALEQAWVKGEISAIDCLTQQLQLIDILSNELAHFAQSIAIDEGFIRFYHHYKDSHSITIASDGLKNIILPVLEKHGITDCPVNSGHIEMENGSIGRVAYPYHLDCPNGNGTCKCKISGVMDDPPPSLVILIGDGRSDFCLAQKVHFTFAKDKLAQFCQNNHLAYHPIHTFDDVVSYLEREMSNQISA